MKDVESLNKDKYKESILIKLKSKIPPLQVIRISIKATVAVMISLSFALIHKTKGVIGTASTLCTLATLLYFPVKPVGANIKVMLLGVISASIGAVWSLLANYLANLARDPNIHSPMQPSSSAVSAVFCTLLIFTIVYVRTNYPQLLFGTVFAGMIGSFAMTQNANAAGFQPKITWTFLDPLLFATGISLFVNLFLWPEDDATTYFNALSRALEDYKSLYQETIKTFLEYQISHMTPENSPTLSKLRTKLQNALIQLVDKQHEVEFVMLHCRFSQKDMAQMTQKIKEMRTPLHGIGLSLLLKHQRSNDGTDTKKSAEDKMYPNVPIYKELFPFTESLRDACIKGLDESIHRIQQFKVPPRSLMSTIFWPFPRLFINKKDASRTNYEMTSDHIQKFIDLYESEIRAWRIRHHDVNNQAVTRQVAYLFQFNMISFANGVQSFITLLENLDYQRPPTKKFWFPSVPLKKWVEPSKQQVKYGSKELNDICQMHVNDKPGPRDPDVNEPVTNRERFFCRIDSMIDWFYSRETIFAIKSAVGFILLSLPAYLPQSVGWFTSWGGQWVANTLLMWMIPMAGMFNFTIILGLFGTICGGVLSIALWEIVRGNSYGLVVLSFILFVPLYYIFFTNNVYSYMVIMTQYSYLMIVTFAYNAMLIDPTQKDSIEINAGKRMMFVVLGIVGSFVVNLIPRPTTGRKELRKRISRTFYDMSMIYGILFTDIMRDNDDQPTKRQTLAFRRLTLHIQRQLKEEETYLRLSKLEPPLKGKFPYEIYRELIEKLNNMADILEGMALTTSYMDHSWRSKLLGIIDKERFDYVAFVSVIMRQLSSALISKLPLPPYSMSPNELKKRYSERLYGVLSEYPEQIKNDTFTSYCAYSISCYLFIEELNDAIVCVENLLGIESPQKWLILNA